MSDLIKILSWNVNGLRACGNKGHFAAWLDTHGPDIAALQEVRATPEQLPEALRQPPGYVAHFNAAEQLGYSGVGTFSKRAPDAVEVGLFKKYDLEGRFLMTRYGALTIVNGYFPNGNGKERDNSRIPYKLGFYRAVHRRLVKAMKAGERILVMGDFNTAHTELDLARPKQNVKTSGFTPTEREELDQWVAAGWVDTFRHFEPGPDHYSWWSQRLGARERNVGWRIDYVFASPGAMPFVREAMIQKDVLGSDHCPVGVIVDAAIMDGRSNGTSGEGEGEAGR